VSIAAVFIDVAPFAKVIDGVKKQNQPTDEAKSAEAGVRGKGS
jgi:hypothetical protein